MDPRPRTPAPPQGDDPRRIAVRLARRAWAALREWAIARARAVARVAAWTWARRPPRPRLAASALAAAVSGLGAWSILFQASLAARLPGALDWAAAAALVDRDARPGDAAFLSPAWIERAREALPGRVPVLAFPRLAGEDLVGVRRAWLFSVPDAPGADRSLEMELLDRASGSDGPHRLGAMEVARFELAAPVLPLAFLPDRLRDAQVALGDDACTPDGTGGFECHGAPIHVTREVREIDGLPRPCLVVPIDAAAGAALAVSFADVPMGRAVRGHAAATVSSGARGDPPLLGATTRLAVDVDGEEVGSVEIEAGRRGWQTFHIDTTRHAGRASTIALAVTAAGPDAPALCIDAVTLQ